MNIKEIEVEVQIKREDVNEGIRRAIDEWVRMVLENSGDRRQIRGRRRRRARRLKAKGVTP
jgi:hypothetical protein